MMCGLGWDGGKGAGEDCPQGDVQIVVGAGSGC